MVFIFLFGLSSTIYGIIGFALFGPLMIDSSFLSSSITEFVRGFLTTIVDGVVGVLTFR